MSAKYDQIREVILQKVGEYLDEFSGHLMEAMSEDKDSRFRFSAIITSDEIEFSSGIGVAGVKGTPRSEKLSDPNQGKLEV